MAIKSKSELKNDVNENKLTKQNLIDIIDSTQVENGLYTPEITLISSNITSASPSDFNYQVIGGTNVRAQGNVLITVDSTAIPVFTISLPLDLVPTITSTVIVHGYNYFSDTNVYGSIGSSSGYKIFINNTPFSGAGTYRIYFEYVCNI